MDDSTGSRSFESISSQGRDSSIHRLSPIPKTSFVHVDDRFICPKCGDILKDPVQTPCGHRMCERCSEALCEGGSPVQCPASDKEDPCEPIYKEQVFRDASARREIAQLPVFCSNASLGCTVTVPWKSLKRHLETCPYRMVECPNKQFGCSVVLADKDVTEHAKQSCEYRQVTCKQCTTSYSVKNEKVHVESECPETVMECPYKCGVRSMKRKEILEHRKSCKMKPHECEFKNAGCTFVGSQEEVRRHVASATTKHLELITVYTSRMELQNMDIKTQLQELQHERDMMKTELTTRTRELEEIKKKLESSDKTMKELRLKQVGLFERVIKIERRFEELPRRELLEQQSRDLQSIKQRVEELQNTVQNTEGGQVTGRFGSLSNMADSMTTQLTTHDRQIGIHDVRIAEMDLRFQILETASYDGVLLWKIRDYTRRKQEAVSGRTLSLYSQPFYTHKYGYKMCARVYLNGDGMGKTTHISLFFVIMRGEYDSLLPWPFGQKVTLYLLDQGLERRHLSDHFHPDPNSSSFRKPQTEMNIASGCPLFVSHSVLENPASNYLKDDTIFIKVAVETANLRTV